ncbi:MAG: tetratricopeptide repeat protein [Planctomycetota bacterium]
MHRLAWTIALSLAAIAGAPDGGGKAPAPAAGKAPASVPAQAPPKESPMARLKTLRTVASAKPADADVLREYGAFVLQIGRLEEAEEAGRRLSRISPSEPSGAVLVARACERRGRTRSGLEALGAFLERRPADADALAWKARLLEGVGDRAAAVLVARGILEPPAGARPASPWAKGIALGILGRFSEARAALAEAAKPPSAHEARIDLARLLASKHNFPEAEVALAETVKADPNIPAAWTLYARILLDGPEYRIVEGRTPFERAERGLRRALAIAPWDPEAFASLAMLCAISDREADARRLAASAIREDPGCAEALGVLRALDVALPPADLPAARRARAFLEAGRIQERRMRRAEALDCFLEARALDPASAEILAALGSALFDDGQEEVAKNVLAEAFRLDPFDARLKNRIDLAERLLDPKVFETIRGSRVTVRGDLGEGWFLRTHLLPAAERIHAELSKTFGFEPEEPLIVEMFADRSDFSVRAVGLDGLLGVEGVCLGRVIAMPSPSRAPFPWHSALRHEMAHAFSGALSQNRVPRWLGEGISMHVQGDVSPWFFIRIKSALALDRVPSIQGLDAEFRRPHSEDDVRTAYAVAGIAANRIAADKGEAALGSMLRAAGRNATLEEMLKEGTGENAASFDAALAGPVRAAANRYPLDPPGTEAGLPDLARQSAARPDDADLLERLARAKLAAGDIPGAQAAAMRAAEIEPARAEAHFVVGIALSRAGSPDLARAAFERTLKANPMHAGANLALGALDSKAGRTEEAERRLREAIRLAPDFVHPPEGFENPYRMLARILEASKREAAAREVHAAWAARDPEAIEPRRRLAANALAANDALAAIPPLDEALRIAPFDPEIRRLRAEAFERVGRREEAGVERGILQAILARPGKAP